MTKKPAPKKAATKKGKSDKPIIDPPKLPADGKLFDFAKAKAVGFEQHSGGEPPVDPETYVELVIRTEEGFGSSGIIKAKYHDWTIAPGELGAVNGYRVIAEGDTPAFKITERF